MNNINYFSNKDKNIYSIANLPEEVIAVIFAYVSRSPKSFRENISAVTDEKAANFHEKWVLEYGHASVAEHAVVHLGIEKISRLFSAILERSNPYLSFTEYSQRYQKPKINDYYIPKNLGTLTKEYIHYQETLYTSYTKILHLLQKHYTSTSTLSQNHIEKLAFEDARYVLSLATYTNLGMTGNARALSDCIKVLLSSQYDEVKERAEEMKVEAQHVVPTLLKYPQKNDFLHKNTAIVSHNSVDRDCNAPPSLLLNKKHVKTERESLIIILEAHSYTSSYQGLHSLSEQYTKSSDQDLMGMFCRMMADYTRYDIVPSAFNEINYRFEIYISEACYHQLLRHRRINIYEKPPHVTYGYVVPPVIEQCKEAMKIFHDLMLMSAEVFTRFEQNDICLAHYIVTNAHRRALLISLTLKELYHLVLLRTGKNTQWEFRELAYCMVRSVKEVHPLLVGPLWKLISF